MGLSRTFIMNIDVFVFICQDKIKRRATALSKSIDLTKFDFHSAIARRLKTGRATVNGSILICH